MTFTTAALLLAWAAILTLTLAVAGLLGQVRSLRREATSGLRVRLGPAVGEAAPPLAIPSVQVPRPALVLFADQNCEVCTEVIPAFATRNGRDGATDEDVTKVIVFPGDASETAGEHASQYSAITLTNQRDAFEAWNIRATPYCVFIDDSGRVLAAGPVGSRESLNRFMERVLERSRVAPAR